MGYFDVLASASFKQDTEGNVLFYRWGIFGKAYVIPNNRKANEIKKFIAFYYKASLPLLVGVVIIPNWIYIISAAIILFAWFHIKISSLTKGLAISEAKLSMRESYTNVARLQSKTALFTLFFFSVLMVLGGVLIIYRANDIKDILIGSSSILFFGLGTAVYVYMVKLKGN